MTRPADARRGLQRRTDDSVAVRHDLAHEPMRDPSNNGGLHKVLSHRYLLKLMVRREIKARYVGSKFGLAWSYINPTVRFFTFYFVFGIILQRGAIPHFAIHLFAGMVLVHFFTESFNAGTRSIMANKAVGRRCRCHGRCSRSPRCWSRSTTPARSWSS